MSPSIKLGLCAGLTVTAACLLLVLLAPPDAPAAPAAVHATTATLVATVAGADALDAVPDPAGRTIFFVTDGPGGPAIMRVPAGGGAVRTVLAGKPLVDPTGLAVAADGRRLLLVNTATLATSTFDDVIGANRAAGGLHRGLRTAVMAWADVQRPGRVYRVDP